MAAAAAPAAAAPVELINELPAGTPPPEGYIALIATDADGSKHRFPAHVATFRKYSKFAQNVFTDDIVDATLQDMPVDSDSGSSRNLRFFATWLKRRETTKPSRIRVPTPDLPTSQKLFPDEFDHELLQQHVCPAVIPTEKPLLKLPSDLTDAPACMSLALLAIYFEAEDLTKMCVTWLAFFMRRRIQETRDPDYVAMSWLKRTEPFTDEEKNSAQKFWDEATADVELPEDTEFAEEEEVPAAAGAVAAAA